MGFSCALLPSIIVILKYEMLFVPISPPRHSSSPMYQDPKNKPILTSKLNENSTTNIELSALKQPFHGLGKLGVKHSVAWVRECFHQHNSSNIKCLVWIESSNSSVQGSLSLSHKWIYPVIKNNPNQNPNKNKLLQSLVKPSWQLSTIYMFL